MADTTDSIGNAIISRDTMASDRASLGEQEDESGQTFPLLDLPPELWTNICRLAVTYECEIAIDDDLASLLLREHRRQPAITRTCTIIRNETLALFYSSNTFAVHDDDTTSWILVLCTWLKAIGPANYCHLRQLYVLALGGDNVDYDLEESYMAGDLPLVVLETETIDESERMGEKSDDLVWHWLGLPSTRDSDEEVSDEEASDEEASDEEASDEEASDDEVGNDEVSDGEANLEDVSDGDSSDDEGGTF